MRLPDHCRRDSAERNILYRNVKDLSLIILFIDTERERSMVINNRDIHPRIKIKVITHRYAPIYSFKISLAKIY